MNENFDENKINPNVEDDLEAESEVIDETESKEVYEAAEAEELAKAKAEKGEKIMTKKNFLLLICTMVIGIAIGFGLVALIINGASSAKKTFNYENMSITLTNAFVERITEGADATYDSGEVAVFAQKHPAPDEGIGSAIIANTADFANWIILKNNYKNTRVESNKNFSSFVVDKEDYRYYFYTYKSEDNFWLIYFAVDNENIEKYESKITEWASSVEFK